MPVPPTSASAASDPVNERIDVEVVAEPGRDAADQPSFVRTSRLVEAFVERGGVERFGHANPLL